MVRGPELFNKMYKELENVKIWHYDDDFPINIRRIAYVSRNNGASLTSLDVRVFILHFLEEAR